MASSSTSSTVAARISAFRNRTTTNFGSDTIPERTFPRKQRSLGSLIGHLDGANELAEARARLKHVGEFKKSPKKEETMKAEPDPLTAMRRRRTNSSVLEELDGLLDTAIGEHATQFTTNYSRDTIDDATPDWPLPRTKSVTSKSPSRYAMRHSGAAAKRRQSRQRQLQSDSSDNLGSNAATYARGPSIDSNRPRSSTDTDVGHCHPLLSEVEREPLRIEVPKQLQNIESPIKQRAALFENLSQHEALKVHEIPHIHDSRNPRKIRGVWPPKQDAAGKEIACNKFVASQEKHHLQFHHGKDEALVKDNADSPPRASSPEKSRTTHVPPIPLTLPQLISPRRRSRPDVTALRDPLVPSSKSDEPEERGHTFHNWPLKWDILRKSPKVPMKEASIVARAEPDHHTSAKKIHESQHRVYNLLVAAQDATKEPTLEPISDQPEDMQYTPARVSMPGASADNLRGSSAAEKEVASLSSATPAGTVTPGTPRGRHRLQDLEAITHSPVGEQDGTYKVEQKFALSRSRSRGGSVRVQVEIRSPTASPERGGEHTVIVTANVTPLDEQDEELNGAE